MYCKKCGERMDEGDKICSNCGEVQDAQKIPSHDVYEDDDDGLSLKHISVWKVVLFSILTGYIYTFVWYYKRTNELNAVDGYEKSIPSFILFPILGMLTGGIYFVYWLYKFYKKLDSATGGDDKTTRNLLLTLFLGFIFGVGFAQNQINKEAKR